MIYLLHAEKFSVNINKFSFQTTNIFVCSGVKQQRSLLLLKIVIWIDQRLFETGKRIFCCFNQNLVWYNSCLFSIQKLSVQSNDIFRLFWILNRFVLSFDFLEIKNYWSSMHKHFLLSRCFTEFIFVSLVRHYPSMIGAASGNVFRGNFDRFGWYSFHYLEIQQNSWKITSIYIQTFLLTRKLSKRRTLNLGEIKTVFEHDILKWTILLVMLISFEVIHKIYLFVIKIQAKIVILGKVICFDLKIIHKLKTTCMTCAPTRKLKIVLSPAVKIAKQSLVSSKEKFFRF